MSSNTDSHVCRLCDRQYAHKKSLYNHCRKVHSSVLEHCDVPQLKKKLKFESQIDSHIPPLLEESLPAGFECHIANWQYTSDKDKEKYDLALTLKINTVDAAIEFKKKYEEHNKIKFILIKTEKNLDSCLLRNRYSCHFNSQKKNEKNRKNINCPAFLNLTVLNQKSDDRFQCDVVIHHEHNHTKNAAALKWLQPTEEVVEKFTKMFQAGITPNDARKMHEDDLFAEYGDEFYQVCADRSVCPDQAWIFKYYYQIYDKKYGKSTGADMIISLEKQIQEYREEFKQDCILLKTEPNGKFTIAVATPLMKRVSEYPTAADICFLDSSGNMDRFGCRVFLLMTTSCAGGLPLGVFITTSETEICIKEGIKLLSSLFSKNAFGGRGGKGPHLFITDICDAEMNALKNLYPESTLILCIFHVLQAAWRWVCDRNHQITVNSDKVELFETIKTIMYAKNEQDLLEKIDLARNSIVVKKYKKFEVYLESWLGRKESWALCLRDPEHLRGQDTNNTVEAAMKVLKDQILQRARAYSPGQLLDFIVRNFSSFYEKKLLKIAADRPDNYLKKKKKLVCKPEDYEVNKLSDTSFEIINLKHKDKEAYYLHCDISLCTCPAGNRGSKCKHFSLIKNKTHILDLPVTEDQKKELHFLATGNTNIKPNWYGPLQILESDADRREEEEEIARKEEVMTVTVNTKNDDEEEENKNIENEESDSSVLTDLEESFRILKDRISKDSKIFQEPVAAFKKNCLKKVATDASLMSAFHNFGKVNGRRKLNGGNSMIPVQPTAISRRKSAYGGRKALTSGRPPKSSFAPEHGYSEKRKDYLLPKFNKRQKMPHKLSALTDLTNKTC